MPTNSWREVGALWKSIFRFGFIGKESGKRTWSLGDTNHSVVTEDIWEIYLKNFLLIQMETLMLVCIHVYPNHMTSGILLLLQFCKAFLLVD